MITLRSSTDTSKPTLIGFEATLTTSSGVYEFSSNGPIVDPNPRSSDGLLAAIVWPRSRFQLPDGVFVEQQMFLPQDGSAVALTWELGGASISAHLIMRPLFSGCSPRSYRDIGFHFESEQEGGRLTWLPNVRGPKIIADTNGKYHDEPLRLQETAVSSNENLTSPGTFEFELNRHPSVLIFSMNDSAKTHVGGFLAGLMQSDNRRRTAAMGNPRRETETRLLAA